MIRGFTCGAMDLLHAGHVLMLKECKDGCDYLIVGLQTDPTIDRPHKNKPIETIEERKIRLEGCKYVDEIIIYSTEVDLYNILKNINPDVRFVGGDYKGKDFTGSDLPIPVIYNNRDHDYSSSNLRKRITEQNSQ
jgi:glycerol-3-phosphate cytidylyltransferase